MLKNVVKLHAKETHPLLPNNFCQLKAVRYIENEIKTKIY